MIMETTQLKLDKNGTELKVGDWFEVICPYLREDMIVCEQPVVGEIRKLIDLRGKVAGYDHSFSTGTDWVVTTVQPNGFQLQFENSDIRKLADEEVMLYKLSN